MLLLVDLSSDA